MLHQLRKQQLDEKGLSHKNPIMVGDRKHDIIGAKEAGIPCMAVAYGYGSMQELTATISMLSTTANDLMKISEKLNSEMKFFKI